MQETSSSIFMPPPRKALLPTWIKAFCWFYIVVSGIQVIAAIYQYRQMELEVFGIDLVEVVFQLQFLMPITSIFYPFTMLTAYGLLREKDWGVTIAIVYGLFMAIEYLCKAILISPGTHPPDDFVKYWFTFIAAVIILGKYLRKLFSIRKEWSARSPSGRSF